MSARDRILAKLRGTQPATPNPLPSLDAHFAPRARGESVTQRAARFKAGIEAGTLNPRDVKIWLAKEIITRYHDEAAAEAAARAGRVSTIMTEPGGPAANQRNSDSYAGKTLGGGG